MVRRLVSGLVCAVAVVGAGPATATPATAAAVATVPAVDATVTGGTSGGPSCTSWDVNGARPDGQVSGVLLRPGRSPLSAGSLGATSDVQVTGMESFRWVDYFGGVSDERAFTVQGGRLVLAGQRGTVTTTDSTIRPFQSVVGSGWGRTTSLLDASLDTDGAKNGYLYGFDRTSGSLTRYRVTEPTRNRPVVRTSAQLRTFAGYRTMTFAYASERGTTVVSHVFLAETNAGALVLLTVPLTGSFRVARKVIKPSTWTFDEITVSRCTVGAALTARRGDTAHLFTLDLRLAVPGIRYVGASSGPLGLRALGPIQQSELTSQWCDAAGRCQ